MGDHDLVEILEGALLAAGEPLSKKQLAQLFDELERPSAADITTALDAVAERCEGRGFELAEVASGFRFQVRQHLSPWVSKLWVERPVRYSRALLETLSLIAYRQPITRGEIEDIRGVAVSSNIMKSLLEREWVKVVGHRDVPGKPAMYATTREFLDYFNLKTLDQLPPLADVKDLETMTSALPLEEFHDARGDNAESERAENAETAESDIGVKSGDDGERGTSATLSQGIAVDALDEVDGVEVDEQ
jgi:segregation and condensation protein B